VELATCYNKAAVNSPPSTGGGGRKTSKSLKFILSGSSSNGSGDSKVNPIPSQNSPNRLGVKLSANRVRNYVNLGL